MRAVALFSGGLDSALAVKLIQRQQIEVVGLYIDLGFEANREKRAQLRRLAEQLGIELLVEEVVEEYLREILFRPRYGYGKGMNPCIDCHAFMIKKGLQVMERIGASFVVTGEVVGQRPMSQRLPALNAVGKLVGEPGRRLVVRPLSGKLLPPTIPEERGWIDREQLLDIRGRDRNRQLQLARELGLEGFESPGGGCLLTDLNFSRRLRLLGEITPAEIPLLRVGRHFQIAGKRIVVSRHREENPPLRNYSGERFWIGVPQFPGPVVAVEKGDPALLKWGADLAVTYSRFPEGVVEFPTGPVEGVRLEKGEVGQFLI